MCTCLWFENESGKMNQHKCSVKIACELFGQSICSLKTQLLFDIVMQLLLTNEILKKVYF